MFLFLIDIDMDTDTDKKIVFMCKISLFLHIFISNLCEYENRFSSNWID